MATIAVGDIYQVRIVTALGSQLGEMIMHYECTAVAGTSSTDSALAVLIDAAAAPLVKPLLTNAASYQGVGVQRIFPTPRLREVVVTTGSGGGTGGASALPSQVSGLIKKVSATAGRSSQGRNYVPFPDESQNQASGIPAPAYVGDLFALGNSMIGPFTPGGGGNTATLKQVIYNRINGGTAEVTEVIPAGVWATQRRRGDFGKSNIIPF